MGIRREPISDLLSSLGATPEQLSQAREMADKSGSSLLEAASSGGTVTGSTVAKAVAATLGISTLEEVDVERIDVELVRPLPLGLSRENGVPLAFVAKVGNGHRGNLEPFGPARLGRPTGPLRAAHRTGGAFPCPTAGRHKQSL